MKDIAEKLKRQERNMAEEKGPFDLFALFLREDAPEKWDLVVAAKWIEENKREALKYISKAVQESLAHSEFLKLSRITIIDESNPELETFQRAMQFAMYLEHGMAEIKNSNFFGLEIKHAYIITSQQRDAV